MRKAWFTAVLCGAVVLAANAAFAADEAAPAPDAGNAPAAAAKKPARKRKAAAKTDAPVSQVTLPSPDPHAGQLYTSLGTADETANLKPGSSILDQRPSLTDCVDVSPGDKWCAIEFELAAKDKKTAETEDKKPVKLYVRMNEFSNINDSTVLYESRPLLPGEKEIASSAGKPGQYQWRDIPVLHDLRMWFVKGHFLTSPTKSQDFALIRKIDKAHSMKWCVAWIGSEKCEHNIPSVAEVAQKGKKGKGAAGAAGAAASSDTVKSLDEAIDKLFIDPAAQALVRYDIALETEKLKGKEKKAAEAAFKKELMEAANPPTKDEDRQKTVDKWAGKTGKVKALVTDALIAKPNAAIADFLKTLNDKTKPKSTSEDALLAFYCPDIPAESLAPTAASAAPAAASPSPAPAVTDALPPGAKPKAPLPKEVPEVQTLTALTKTSPETQNKVYTKAADKSGAVAGGETPKSSELREKCRKWNKEHVPPSDGAIAAGGKNLDVGKEPPAPKAEDPNAHREPIAAAKLGIWGGLLALMGPFGLALTGVALVTVAVGAAGYWMSKEANK